MKSVVFFIVLSIFLTIWFVSSVVSKPETFHYFYNNSIVLTNTRLTQLQNGKIIELLFDEQNKTPQILGWDNDTLYFIDTAAETFSFNAKSNRKKLTAYIPNILKQVPQQCLGEKSIVSYDSKAFPPHISRDDLCVMFQQRETQIYSWAFQSKYFLEFNRRILVLSTQKNEIILNEKRKIGDLAISESGQYVAIVASNSYSDIYPARFRPMDIHVIKLY